LSTDNNRRTFDKRLVVKSGNASAPIHRNFTIVPISRSQRLSVLQFYNVRQSPCCPPLRDWAEFGVLELTGEQCGGGGIHALGLAAFGLGADGVEVHEPGLEQSLGDGFEGGVCLAQSLHACSQGGQQRSRAA